MNIALRRFLHNHEERSRDYALLLFRMTSRAFSSAQYTIGSTVHSRLLNSLEHWICTTTMTKIRPDRDSNLVPPGYKPQSIRMRHRDRLPLPRSEEGTAASMPAYMDKGPEKVQVWRLWPWFGSPGRVRRTRPGGLNQCHNFHTSTIRVIFMHFLAQKIQKMNCIDLELFKTSGFIWKLKLPPAPTHHWPILPAITWHIPTLRHRCCDVKINSTFWN